ncbi:MAG: UDP-N-acetylmuramate dehydrogenase [Pseudohongiella sp.]|nr:UDP-N-acetylmuramate dehydrogenase [Pseudohongiella sp.]
MLNNNWLQNVALGPLTSFGVPARARYFTRLEQEDELPILLQEADHKDLPVLMLGGGSNMLFTEDFPGLVIQIALTGISVRPDPDAADKVLITAAAGENWHALVEFCLNNQLVGLENLALIPGSTGAAPVQNIGAYGVELSDVLENVRYFDRRTQQVQQLGVAECHLSYRDSIFKHELKDHAVILSVCLRLSKNARPHLSYPALQHALSGIAHPGARDVFDAVCAIRRSKLPDPRVLGNAGSFFRNPLVSVSQWQALLLNWPDLPSYASDSPDMRKLPAAWLIEKAGWKGMRSGDAGVHTEQALVLVNHGQATGQQLLALAHQVARSVKALFNITLEPEVNILPAKAWQGQ